MSFSPTNGWWKFGTYPLQNTTQLYRKTSSWTLQVSEWISELMEEIIIYKHLSLYPKISVVFTSYQGDCSLYQTDTATENQNQAKEPSLTGYFYKTLLNLRFKEYCRGGCGWIVRARRSGSFLWDLFPSNIRSHTHKNLTNRTAQTWT